MIRYGKKREGCIGGKRDYRKGKIKGNWRERMRNEEMNKKREGKKGCMK